MIGGGSFHLKPGEWTDDTSMALCLAESLIEKRMLAQSVANHLGAQRPFLESAVRNLLKR